MVFGRTKGLVGRIIPLGKVHEVTDLLAYKNVHSLSIDGGKTPTGQAQIRTRTLSWMKFGSGVNLASHTVNRLRFLFSAISFIKIE